MMDHEESVVPFAEVRRSRRAVRATHVSWGHVFEAKTRDVRDHTFSGIMFDVECKATLPTECVEISTVAVRGDLGLMRVFATRGGRGYGSDFDNTDAWTLVYEGNHEPSMSAMVSLELDEKVTVRAREIVGLYVHSARVGAHRPPDSIVYASQRGVVTCDSDLVAILPGMAHTSATPFSNTGFFRMGGSSWRPHREFVGSLEFGVRWLCWNPRKATHRRFPCAFRTMVRTMLLCHHRPESPLHSVPHGALFHILNMCAWEWAYPTDLHLRAKAVQADREQRRDATPPQDASAADDSVALDRTLVCCRDNYGASVMVPRDSALARACIAHDLDEHDDDYDYGDDDDVDNEGNVDALGPDFIRDILTDPDEFVAFVGQAPTAPIDQLIRAFFISRHPGHSV